MLNSKAEFYLWWKESNVQIKSKRKQVWQEISYAVKECSSEKKLSCIIWSSHFSLSTELKPWCLLAKNFSTILFRITDSTEPDIVVDALRDVQTRQRWSLSRLICNCLRSTHTLIHTHTREETHRLTHVRSRTHTYGICANRSEKMLYEMSFKKHSAKVSKAAFDCPILRGFIRR